MESDRRKLSASEAPESLQAAETELRFRERQLPELCHVFDRNGNWLFGVEGGADRILFSDSELAQMDGALLTHNHPTGRSFSPEDITLLVYRGLQELRAVTRDYVYTASYQGEDRVGFYFELRQKLPLVTLQMEESLSEAVRLGRINELEKDLLFWHGVWAKIAPQLKLRYSRQKLSE